VFPELRWSQVTLGCTACMELFDHKTHFVVNKAYIFMVFELGGVSLTGAIWKMIVFNNAFKK
jgi:hypothetical protein